MDESVILDVRISKGKIHNKGGCTVMFVLLWVGSPWVFLLWLLAALTPWS
jgi:hypothetical protein